MYKKAVILAAGMGQKCVPYTFDYPKGLLIVREETIVERLIKQLNEKDITDITIVVGFKSKKFNTLIDTYNLKSIKSKKYATTYSLNSLALVGSLENTVIVTSDLYLFENHLGNDTQSNVYVQNGEVGYAYLDQEDGKKVTEKIATLSQDYIDAHNYDVVVKEIPTVETTGVFKVINTIEDLRNLDARYCHRGSHEIVDLMCGVFECEPKAFTHFESLKKGMTNDSFLFNVDDRRYVFRVPGKGTSELINRQHETDVYQVISPLNISDEIQYIDPDKGYKITKYYENAKTIDSSKLPLAMGIIKDLHNRDLKVAHSFDLKERIVFYESLCVQNNASKYENQDETHNQVMDIYKWIDSLNRKHTLCHVDPVIDNFLELEDGSIKLLDWEYASMADPLLDVAMHAIYSYMDKEAIDNLIEIYLERKPSMLEQALVYGYVALAGYVWSQWTLYKDALGEEFGDYGLIQYNYAVEFSAYLDTMGEAV